MVYGENIRGIPFFRSIEVSTYYVISCLRRQAPEGPSLCYMGRTVIRTQWDPLARVYLQREVRLLEAEHQRT